MQTYRNTTINISQLMSDMAASKMGLCIATHAKNQGTPITTSIMNRKKVDKFAVNSLLRKHDPSVKAMGIMIDGKTTPRILAG
jgi:hypothetical protein